MSRLKTFVLSPTRVSYLRRAAAICGMGLAMLTMSTQVLAAVAPVSVSGNKVLFGGQVGSISGASMFWSNTGWGGDKYYNAQAVSWLKTDWKANLVRAAMGVNDTGGYLSDVSNKTRAMAVIDGAIANNMYVIIDFHSHVAHQYQAQSIAFFQEMATKYGNTNNIIYEIYNEPLQVSWSSVIKPYAVEVIKAIRAIDPDNLIIVGTPTWSQDVDVAALDPIVGYGNIAYTLHFYAGTHKQSLRDKAATALSRGIPLFVTEWGSTDASGDGAVNVTETNAWVAFMKANNISNANWSIVDKAEGSAALVAGASATGGWTQLTASGALAKSITQGWPAITGVVSSVAASSQVATSRSSTATSAGNQTSITIQAEAYTAMSGIQTETTQDTGGGSNVGYTDTGDWMSYAAVNLPCSGTYTVEYRVASGTSGGKITLQQSSGSPVYGAVTVAGTGGWQNWTTVSHDVTLPAGNQSFAIAVTQGGWNLNWFRLTPKCGVGASSTAASGTPPSSTPSSLSSVRSSVAPSSSGVTSSAGTGLGNWQLSATDSYLNFVTTKNANTIEVQKFDTLSGSLSNAGLATLVVNLASVNTANTLRDQRLRDLFFETGLFPTATATFNLDTSVLSAIAVGQSATVDLAGTLDLHGVTGLLSTRVLVQKLSSTRVLVQSVAPVIVRSADYNLSAGVEALRAAVGITSVSGIAPVDFALVFNAQ